MVVALLSGMATGLPVAFVLGSVAVCFSLALWGPSSLYALATSGLSVLNNYVLLAVPLFTLMAMILFKSGMAEDMYDAVHKWSGPIRGGLGIATIVVCTLFAAVVGLLAGVVVTMGLIALPSMLKRNYRKDIALGSILGGTTLGPLIPPSVPAIVYGMMAGTSIGGLFAGGLITGLILSCSLSISAYGRIFKRTYALQSPKRRGHP
jgi:tripartite ATP-independent transporter DctM subunit